MAEPKDTRPPSQDGSDEIETRDGEMTTSQEKRDDLEDLRETQSTLSRTDSSESEDDVEGNPVALSQTTSIVPPPVTVPRNKRRGLFANLAVLPEVEVPKHYPRKTKWFITFVVAVAGAAAPMGSAIFFRECISCRLLLFPADWCSCAGPGREGPQHDTHRNQSFRRPVHAQYVDIPAVVVVVQ